MDVNGVAHDVVRKVVRFTMNDAGARAAAGHPHGEAARMVVAAVVVAAEAAL
jgi:hypothetical protein